MIVDILTKNLDLNLMQKIKNKPATIFDHLANITWKKKPWSELSELDQKSFSPYLINRWLSMNPDLIEIVDMFQQYTIGPLSKKHVYQLYLDFLPKAKMFAKYINDSTASAIRSEPPSQASPDMPAPGNLRVLRCRPNES